MSIERLVQTQGFKGDRRRVGAAKVWSSGGPRRAVVRRAGTRCCTGPKQVGPGSSRTSIKCFSGLYVESVLVFQMPSRITDELGIVSQRHMV